MMNNTPEDSIPQPQKPVDHSIRRPMAIPRATKASLKKITDNVPQELQDLPTWVMWSGESRLNDPNKASKRPINPRTGGDAKSDDPSTWSSLNPRVIKRASVLQGVSGLGVNLLGQDYVGLDLDNIINPQTGEINAKAAAMLDDLPPTYTEVSPSGKGLRLFFRGQKPTEFLRCNVPDAFGAGSALEVYDGSKGGRYLTVTGEQWGSSHIDKDHPIAILDDSNNQALVEVYETRVRVRQSAGASGGPLCGVTWSTGLIEDDDLDRAQFILNSVFRDPDILGYEGWIDIVMCLASAGEAGQELAREWSSRGAKFDGSRDCTPAHFAGFRNDRQLSSLFYLADNELPSWRDAYDRTRGRGSQIIGEADRRNMDALAESIMASDEKKRDKATSKGLDFPYHLIEGNHLIARACRAILERSNMPQPSLSLASMLAMFATVVSRRRMLKGGEHTTNANVFCVGVAPTASGKSVSGRHATKWLRSAGLDRLIGPTSWKSDSGIASSVREQPVHLCILDEVGKFVEAARSDRAPAHLKNVTTMLLELYSTDALGKAAYSNPGKTEGHADHSQVLHYPCLSFYGCSTPRVFFKGFNQDSIEDGFLNRLLYFPTDNDYDIQDTNNPTHLLNDSRSIVEDIKSLNEWLDGENKQGAFAESTGLGIKSVRLSRRAKEICSQLNLYGVDKLRHKTKTSPLWGRLLEHSLKVALVYSSVGREPEVSGASMEWAAELVTWCLTRLEKSSLEEMSESDDQGRANDVHTYMKSNVDENGLISKRAVSRRFRNMSKRQRNDVISQLGEEDYVETLTKVDDNGKIHTYFKLKDSSGRAYKGKMSRAKKSK